jgi:hypothetical protein
VSQINKIIFKKFKTGEGDKNEWDTLDSFCILTPQLTSPMTFHPSPKRHPLYRIISNLLLAVI